MTLIATDHLLEHTDERDARDCAMKGWIVKGYLENHVVKELDEN